MLLPKNRCCYLEVCLFDSPVIIVVAEEKLNSATIKFAHRRDAEEAKSSLNGEEVYGNPIKIEWARPISVPITAQEIEERSEVGHIPAMLIEYRLPK